LRPEPLGGHEDRQLERRLVVDAGQLSGDVHAPERGVGLIALVGRRLLDRNREVDRNAAADRRRRRRDVRVNRAGRLAELPGAQGEVERAAKQSDADQRKENDEERQRRTAHHQPEHGDRQRDGDRVPGDREAHSAPPRIVGTSSMRWSRRR